MRGGFLHNELLISGLDKVFRDHGAQTRHEVQTPSGFIDLVVMLRSGALAVEAELSLKRVQNDLKKALELPAASLWIVVPNGRLARSAKTRLRTISPSFTKLQVHVLTFPQAIRLAVKMFF